MDEEEIFENYQMLLVGKPKKTDSTKNPLFRRAQVLPRLISMIQNRIDDEKKQRLIKKDVDMKRSDAKILGLEITRQDLTRDLDEVMKELRRQTNG